LSVASIGARGLSTQKDAATASLHSDIAGDLRKLKAQGDLSPAVTLAVGGRLGSASIRGDLDGARISALGVINPATAADGRAIGTLSIGGNITAAQILAGYDRTGAALNANAGIARVTVGGNWTASDLVAGVTRGIDGMFGTDDDVRIANGNQIIARIASIVIKGSVSGTERGTDHFGFVAEQVGAFKAGRTNFTLTQGASNDLAGMTLGATRDLILREIAQALPATGQANESSGVHFF
jgi:hypothetical protein